MTLAHRMIVMNGGRAEQIGAPMEVYERPATRFVAGFIGSPAMYFVAGRADAAGVKTGSGDTIRLPGALPSALNGREIALGMRPEHLEISTASDAAFAIEVEMIEHLGADTLAHGRFAGEMVIARLPKDFKAVVGERLPLRPQAGQLHFFEGASGARL
jgi:sn-glycerol 3-phosphate transport system ATP-binding protein